MKKIIILTAISVLTASSAFAADSLTLSLAADKTGLTVYGGKASGFTADNQHVIGKASTGVGVGMKVDATAGAGYAMETQHKNSTKAFGSAFDSTSIYTKDVTAGKEDTSGYGKTGSDAFGSGWTTM